VRHAYNLNMNTSRLSNLLGALALALADSLVTQAEKTIPSSKSMSALISIDAHPGETIDALSRVLKLSPSRTSRVIDRLEQDNWVERHRGKDGRAVILFSTPQGKQQVQEFLLNRYSILQPSLDTLSEAEQLQLLHLLEKMLSNLPQNPEQARNICRLCDEATCHIEECPVHHGAMQTG
jgi:MarR family transcriptional regulator, negative regulator of the multidrug operon emrRAB